MESLSEVDVLRFRLADEKVQRANAQLAAMLAERETLRLDVSIRYGLTPADNVNVDTGFINRAPKVTPTEDQKSAV